MNRIFVLKDVVYAAKIGGGTITDYKEINDLAPGAMAFLTEDGIVLTAANAAATLPDVKTIQIASGRANDTSLISLVPRRDAEINNADYRAFVKKVITVGALPVVDNEEGGVSVSDISYTSRYNTRTQRGSDFKTTGKTVTESIDAILAKLNAPASWVVAAKTGTTPNFSITVTPKDEDVDIDVALSGSFSLAPKAITTAPIYGIGRGVDVIQMEKDFSPEMGNANYQDLTDLWNKTPLEGVAATNYDLVTILWEGQHSSPTRSHSVMKNRAVIACPNGIVTVGGQNATDILALTALIFGTAYTATGVEPGTTEATDHDGVAGN